MWHSFSFWQASPLLFLGGKESLRELTIRDGNTTEARITDTRFGQGTGYEVRHTFRVDGQAYTFADSTGRTNLWATLPDRPAGNMLTILYVPEYPWMNRPLETKSNPLGDAMAALILGGVSIIFGIILIIILVIASRKKQVTMSLPSE